jgi:hypothetical protein
MSTTQYYLIETSNYDYLDRIWMWCQFSGRDIPMYKTRIGLGHIGWVVELEDTPVLSLFLLQFSSWVSPIKKPSY